LIRLHNINQSLHIDIKSVRYEGDNDDIPTHLYIEIFLRGPVREGENDESLFENCASQRFPNIGGDVGVLDFSFKQRAKPNMEFVHSSYCRTL
jgi:hypothetical protein